jgi:hypothetical protein
MIRATPAKLLNDPFEGRFNVHQVRDAERNHIDYYRQQGQVVREYLDEHQIKESMGMLQSDIEDVGVISFTESYNNTLMWAHYGDEHKGLVVEFDFNEPFFSSSIHNVDGRATRFKKHFMGTCFELPEKVDYRRNIPDFKRPEFSAPENMNEFHWNKFYKAVLFTKSIDWIYEQEQRSVVRLYDADSIICKSNDYIRTVCEKDAEVLVEELRDDKIQITFPDEYEMHEEMGDQSLKKEICRLVFDDQAMYFFRINPRAISSVYFGCKSNVKESLVNIKNNENLNHLKSIYRMEPDVGLYQFIPKRLLF